MKRIIFLIMTLAIVSSCQIDDIDLFGAERFIYFPTIGHEHAINYTLGGLDEGVIEIPLRYSGRFYEEDRDYLVEVLEVEGTEDSPVINAEENVEFFLPDKFTFRAASDEKDRFRDILPVTVKRSSRMDEAKLNITLKLVSNDNFSASVRDSMVMKIWVTNMIIKPQWWNEEVSEAYLGDYSDVKYKLFIDHVFDGDYGALSAGEQHLYALRFKHWLEENPHYEDGQLITVPVVG